MTNRIHKVWEKILKETFMERFSNCISEDIINNNIKIVIQNFNKYSAECLYKNLVFCSLRTPISKICLDYAVRFIDDFENTFANPYSYEIDENKDKDILNEIIKKQMIVFNHQVETLLHSNINISWNHSHKEISDVFIIEKLSEENNGWVDITDCEYNICTQYHLSSSQIVYASIFGINPQNGRKISESTKQFLSHFYPFIHQSMLIFKKHHPKGVKNLYLI